MTVRVAIDPGASWGEVAVHVARIPVGRPLYGSDDSGRRAVALALFGDDRLSAFPTWMTRYERCEALASRDPGAS